jgi:hypothetical protein
MPDDSTRKLLKVFGVSVTDCEDALGVLTTAVRDPAATPAQVAAAVEAYGRAARELGQRWAESSRLVLEFQLRAQEAVAAYVKARGGAGEGRAVQ